MRAPGPGVNTHEMVLIHRVIRREFGRLPRLFRSAANGRARSKVIDAAMPALIDHLAEEEQKPLPIVSVTLTQPVWPTS